MSHSGLCRALAHRFGRNRDSVDVVVADHAAPRVRESMAGNEMVSIEGGTQALRRTGNARLQISGDRITTAGVPDPYGALILKSAAHSRDPERHLLDAAALLACIGDPYAGRRSTSSSATIEVLEGGSVRLSRRRPRALAACERRPMAAAVYGLRAWMRVRVSRLRWSVSGRVWRYVWAVWIWARPMRFMTDFAVGSRQ